MKTAFDLAAEIDRILEAEKAIEAKEETHTFVDIPTLVAYCTQRLMVGYAYVDFNNDFNNTITHQLREQIEQAGFNFCIMTEKYKWKKNIKKVSWRKYDRWLAYLDNQLIYCASYAMSGGTPPRQHYYSMPKQVTDNYNNIVWVKKSFQ